MGCTLCWHQALHRCHSSVSGRLFLPLLSHQAGGGGAPARQARGQQRRRPGGAQQRRQPHRGHWCGWVAGGGCMCWRRQRAGHQPHVDRSHADAGTTKEQGRGAAEKERGTDLHGPVPRGGADRFLEGAGASTGDGGQPHAAVHAVRVAHGEAAGVAARAALRCGLGSRRAQLPHQPRARGGGRTAGRGCCGRGGRAPAADRARRVLAVGAGQAGCHAGHVPAARHQVTHAGRQQYDRGGGALRGRVGRGGSHPGRRGPGRPVQGAARQAGADGAGRRYTHGHQGAGCQHDALGAARGRQAHRRCAHGHTVN
mmetsp:Transcript_27716/g.70633  ORF Transcript_27716/g.70633 Transcript_27716/m.70633 type:complete len:312 (+) Transcript_27716:309-1244(+)